MPHIRLFEKHLLEKRALDQASQVLATSHNK
jgi:hypothetical protein